MATKPFTLSLGGKKTNAKPLQKKRPISALVPETSDNEDEKQNEPQLVFGFDSSAGGALSKDSETKGPLIIQAQKNRSWQDEAKRKRGKKNLLPQEEQARRNGPVDTQDLSATTQDSERTWGLVIKRKVENESSGVLAAAQEEADEPPKKKKKTADEEALEALLSDKKTDSGLVISNTTPSDDRFAPRSTDEDSYKADVASRPDMASLDDYISVPVEEFGRAMLRGMGWKEGQEIGKNKKKKKETQVKERPVARRPARLGIGAKVVPEDLEFLGAWGKNLKKSIKPQPDAINGRKIS